MKYRYLYQTKENDNRSGEIRAADRAQAYAALRRQGIRPYRLIGDDPKWWQRRRVWWTAAALALSAALAAGAAAFAYSAGDAARPEARAQLRGDAQAIAKGAADNWAGALPLALDRYLAAYAQPGWRLDPPPLSPEEAASFPEELDEPLERSRDDAQEVRQLKNILLKMRQDFRDYLANGGTVEDYIAFLQERQEQECELRDKARETLGRAPESMRQRAWLNLNTRLRDMGLAPLAPLPAEVSVPATHEQ